MQADNLLVELPSPPPVKVYQVSDYECVAATDLASAKTLYLDTTGEAEDDVFEDPFPYEITEQAMDQLQRYDGDGTTLRSFRNALEHDLATGSVPPFFFSIDSSVA